MTIVLVTLPLVCDMRPVLSVLLMAEYCAKFSLVLKYSLKAIDETIQGIRCFRT